MKNQATSNGGGCCSSYKHPRKYNNECVNTQPNHHIDIISLVNSNPTLNNFFQQNSCTSMDQYAELATQLMLEAIKSFRNRKFTDGRKQNKSKHYNVAYVKHKRFLSPSQKKQVTPKVTEIRPVSPERHVIYGKPKVALQDGYGCIVHDQRYQNCQEQREQDQGECQEQNYQGDTNEGFDSGINNNCNDGYNGNDQSGLFPSEQANQNQQYPYHNQMMMANITNQANNNANVNIYQRQLQLQRQSKSQPQLIDARNQSSSLQPQQRSQLPRKYEEFIGSPGRNLQNKGKNSRNVAKKATDNNKRGKNNSNNPNSIKMNSPSSAVDAGFVDDNTVHGIVRSPTANRSSAAERISGSISSPNYNSNLIGQFSSPRSPNSHARKSNCPPQESYRHVESRIKDLIQRDKRNTKIQEQLEQQKQKIDKLEQIQQRQQGRLLRQGLRLDADQSFNNPNHNHNAVPAAVSQPIEYEKGRLYNLKVHQHKHNARRIGDNDQSQISSLISSSSSQSQQQPIVNLHGHEGNTSRIKCYDCEIERLKLRKHKAKQAIRKISQQQIDKQTKMVGKGGKKKNRSNIPPHDRHHHHLQQHYQRTQESLSSSQATSVDNYDGYHHNDLQQSSSSITSAEQCTNELTRNNNINNNNNPNYPAHIHDHSGTDSRPSYAPSYNDMLNQQYVHQHQVQQQLRQQYQQIAIQQQRLKRQRHQRQLELELQATTKMAKLSYEQRAALLLSSAAVVNH